MSVRTSIRRTAVVAAGVLVVVLAPQVAVAAPDASVAFTSPTDTQVWDDALSVTVSGTPADPPTENVTRIVVTPTIGGASDVTLSTSDGSLTCVDDVCTGTLTWDATTPTDQLQAELYVETEGVADSEVLATSATSPFTVVPPVPTVTIDDPSPSTGLKGVISIPATGSTDALWTANAPTSLELLVGDTLGSAVQVDSEACAGLGTSVCSPTLTWDSTPETGTFTLWVRMSTVIGDPVTDSVVVGIDSPEPAISVTAPATGQGPETISVSGSTDASLSEYPTTLVVSLGGEDISTTTCAALTRTCSDSFSYDFTGLTGDQVLTATITTTEGRQNVDSATVAVTSPVATIDLTAPATLQGTTTLSVTASTDADLTEFPTSIVLKRGATTLTTITCAGAPTRTCGGTFDWDSTGLSGDQTLSATVTTTLAGREQTDTATVAVTSPVATIDLTVPTPTKGVTSISVSASTDSDLTEFPTSIVVKRGLVTLTTITCAGAPTRTCGGTFDWDATGLTGDITLTATVTTTLVGRTVSDVVVVAVTTPGPTITFSSPDGGTSLKGVVTLTAGASVDAALTDDPASIAFYDGATLIGTQPCAGSSRECTTSVEWDATLLTGTHVLKAVVTTTRGDTGEVTLSVDVDNPGPGVSITDPAGATASTPGLITVTATGSVDAALTDSTETMEILLDGVVQDALTVTCSVGAKTCPASFELDLTNESGTVAVVVRLTTANGTTGSDSFTLTVDTPAPAVRVVSTLAGTLLGRIPIGVSASTDAGTSDFPSTIDVLVGGTVIGTITCPAGQHTCSGSRAWDSTELPSGSRAVTARVTTVDGIQATSAVKTLVFANPAPTVSITSPSSNAVVKGTVSVAVTARTTSPQTDRPRLIRLYVNGSLRAEATCTVTTALSTCSRTLSWNTSSSVGARSIKVQVWTARPGAVSTYVRTASTTRTYYAFSSTRVTLSAPSVVTSGTAVTLKGRVYSTKTGFGVAGVSVRVFRDPALGDSFTSTVTTDSTGLWTLRVQPRTNTRITVTALAKKNPSGTTWLASSSTSAVQPVSAAMSCTVSTPNLTRGQKGSGSCFVPNLPVGTPLSLRYLQNGSLFTLANGSSKGQTIPFSFTFPKRGTYFLRVDLSANARFVATRSGLMQVTVR